MTQLPQARAGAIFHVSRYKGRFQGEMTPTMPQKNKESTMGHSLLMGMHNASLMEGMLFVAMENETSKIPKIVD